MKFLSRKIDKQLASYQQELIETHYQEVDNMYQQMRGWRHDYRNHIQTMKAYAASGDWDAIRQYLDLLDEDLTTVDTVIKTGNPMTDAILNSKISLARSKNIPVVADAHIPLKLKSSELDLCCILGNLFDNAIEASLKLPEEERMIRVYMDMKKHTALHLFYQFYCRRKVKKAGQSFPQYQRRRARVWSGTHRCHRRTSGRLYQPQQRGRRVYNGDPAPPDLTCDSSPETNISSPNCHGDDFLS